MTLFDGLDSGSSGGPARVRPHGNLTVLRVAVLIMFGLLALRLANLQLVNGAEYRERSENNHIQSEQILPSRGLIYDARGVPLVENVGFYAATIVPELLPLEDEDRRIIYRYLDETLGVPALEIYARIVQAEAEGNEDQAIVVKRHLTREEALSLSETASSMQGVRLTVEPGRNYIGGEALSPILGYIGAQTAEDWARLGSQGYQFNQPVGKAGVEYTYESELRGSVGWSSNEVNAHGDIVNVLDTEEPVAGNSLRLSIDTDLQDYVAALLSQSMGDANKAAAVVMDVNTGAVIALVSVPTYDNNIFGQLELREDEYLALINDEVRRPLLNQAVSAAAPGSVFKLVTASAALQVGNITTSSGRNIPSILKEFKGEDGLIYQYYDWAAHGYVDFYTAIAKSSNLFFFQASCGFRDEGIKGLGDDVEESAYILRYYARAFGYGRLTGIDIGDEAAGVIPDPEWKFRVTDDPYFLPEDRLWYHADTCFMAIGQGNDLATPLQVTRATAAIANGGQLPTPRVVWDVVSPKGETIKRFEPEFETVPVDPEHLTDVRIGMEMSVNSLGGAGVLARQPGLAIAGKTGTAEFVDQATGRTLEHAWFTGYYPYDDPQIAVTVYFDLGVGGVKAAPIAGQILAYYDRSRQ